MNARSVLLAVIDQGYNRASWHGTNLRGSIRRVHAEQAAWRPGSGRHNIWEIVVHAAYWKYAVARRFIAPGAAGGASRRGSFAIKGSNWFRRPIDRANATERAWRTDIALLDEMHDRLRKAVERVTPDELTTIPPGKKVSNFALLSGIAAHDLYHAGQIQLLKRLSALPPSRNASADRHSLGGGG